MAHVQKGDTVRVHYVGTLDDGSAGAVGVCAGPVPDDPWFREDGAVHGTARHRDGCDSG